MDHLPTPHQMSGPVLPQMRQPDTGHQMARLNPQHWNTATLPAWLAGISAHIMRAQLYTVVRPRGPHGWQPTTKRVAIRAAQVRAASCRSSSETVQVKPQTVQHRPNNLEDGRTSEIFMAPNLLCRRFRVWKQPHRCTPGETCPPYLKKKNPANAIRFLRQINLPLKHYNIIRWY